MSSQNIRATKPWLQYTTVCSFLHEKTHVETPHEVAVRDFNEALRHFWATSAEMLWECRFCWQTTRPTMRLLEENVVLLVGRLHLLIDLFDKDDALIQFLSGTPHPTWPVMIAKFPLSLKHIYAMHGDATVVDFSRTQRHRLWPVYPPIRHQGRWLSYRLNSLDDDVELTWPLSETFVYVASRRLTPRLLAKLADMEIPNPIRVIRRMARVARRFFEKGCPPPDEPYPFVSVVVADDLVGPQWSHGLDPPPTTYTSHVRTLRPTKSCLV
ncbi:hypothetical protein B5M09_006250 [Aphanomyces astaci]|uniref:Uncharacterized protein n=1 Tax=Aphanomyces astaci TaxID=112090 RepID=A0A3R7X4H8_APHAT|nr:hypothetical protein B5M09_006250 [Aphanomyces astaci]